VSSQRQDTTKYSFVYLFTDKITSSLNKSDLMDLLLILMLLLCTGRPGYYFMNY